MVNYGDALGRAWKYSLDGKRLGAGFVIFLVAAVIAISPILFIYKTVSLSALNILTMIQFFAWMFVGIAVAGLLMLYAILMFTHNYANQKSLRKSAGFAVSNYPRFLAVTIVTVLISAIVSMVPFIGIILSIITGLMFFFTIQEVAAGSRFSNSIRNSYDMFMEKKLDTFITFVLTGVISGVIILVFAIPLFAVGMSVVFSALSGGALMQALAANMAGVVISGLILLAGFTFATLFTNSVRTDVYAQLKNKRK